MRARFHWPSVPGVAAVGVAALAFALLYLFLDLNKLYALRSGADTGFFLQSLVNFAHSGSTFDWGEGRPHIAVHDSWALYALAPLIALFPRPETLIGVQVLAIAAAAVPLYVFCRSLRAPQWAAVCVALAFLVSPSAQGWAYEDFSENAFVPLIAFSLAVAAQRRSVLWTLLCAQLLMGLKEDEIFFMAWLAVACAIWWERRIGVAVFLLALVNGTIYFGIMHASGAAPAHPSYFFWPHSWPQDLAFFAEVLAPFAFAPLALGWRLLLALPLVAEITLNGPWAYPLARAGNHWTIPLVTLIAVGAAVVIAKRPSVARYALICSIVMALFFNVTVLRFGRHLYVPDWRDYAIARAVAQSGRPAAYTPDAEGRFVIASPNTNVRFLGRARGMLHPQPAWSAVDRR